MFSKIYVHNTSYSPIYGWLSSDPVYGFNFTTLETALAVFDSKKAALTANQKIILFECYDDENKHCKIVKVYHNVPSGRE